MILGWKFYFMFINPFRGKAQKISIFSHKEKIQDGSCAGFQGTELEKVVQGFTCMCASESVESGKHIPVSRERYFYIYGHVPTIIVENSHIYYIVGM